MSAPSSHTPLLRHSRAYRETTFFVHVFTLPALSRTSPVNVNTLPLAPTSVQAPGEASGSASPESGAGVIATIRLLATPESASAPLTVAVTAVGVPLRGTLVRETTTVQLGALRSMRMSAGKPAGGSATLPLAAFAGGYPERTLLLD